MGDTQDELSIDQISWKISKCYLFSLKLLKNRLRLANQNILLDVEYKEYLQLKTAQQTSATIAHIVNTTICLSHLSYVGSWVLDSGASDHAH